jgi:hypothetical protein
MRKLSPSSLFVRISAILVAGALAGTSYVPAARAQEKEKPQADKQKPAADKSAPDKKTKDAARKGFTAGKKAYDKGDYAAAFDGFREANDKIPAPITSYYMASCLDRQGKTEEAVKAYETLLGDPDLGKLDEEKRQDAQMRLGDLKSKLMGVLTLATTPAGAMVTVDGEAQVGETPMELKLKPGAHKIAVTASGYQPKELELTVGGGEKRDESITLDQKSQAPAEAAAAPAPPPPPPPPPPEPKKEKNLVPAYVTLAIAGASAVVGGVFGVMALNKKSDFDKTPTTKNADDTERNALISDMAFGVAITLGVTGVVLLTSSGTEDSGQAAGLEHLPKRAKLTVTPYVSYQGGGAAARLSFEPVVATGH